MFASSHLSDELKVLKVDISQLMNAASEGMSDTAKASADVFATHIKSAIEELGDILSDSEAQFTKLISDRPVATLASAFALGVVIGLVIRR